ncbi:Serine/threonine-protein kinase PknB [Rubripirellula lacrimiformis]|uniref:Serine/threonine-protein kinase PknB n=1 Tax=Rubripirellula lacrimiformis TaxID=1930273 RepID=A0A517NA35_9BACT|nr:serine/threonine-protein kinase [Rubripirellula lacrimiformis]QDT03996.1 Serine/threonine-protein kinase PknB [Rubripirellula lacrimiformis]
MNSSSERTIFFDALEMDDLNQRDRYLDKVCGDNQDLRDSVDALLAASLQPDHPLDRPPVSVPPTSQVEANGELIGQMVGSYRLMEQIGEGGFGLVFVAQQEHPVRRSVALKIVKPGTGSKEVIARFEAERQAVAMMDHPNIARVFDVGVTTDGRPYFVMELVRGVSITQFADAHRMTIRDRLELFVDVCSAVHHAHQKGVIHRDIKPSNVMVTLHDDKPVVKVIDFGVAKAIGQTLTDKTIYTRFFSMIGTPLYMSPEQAEMSGLDVDTRSDIYSLGVMLYELLAGATPFDRDRFDSAGLDEMRRIIREEEPPRPSKRLSTLGAKVSTVSTSRRIEPRRLSSSLRGDLDWIAMKALEKNRNRRYDSAASMAADVTRYLEQQPIQARPPSLPYQLWKFARRHRVVLVTGTVVLMSMILGTAASLWQMDRAISERDQKEQALREIEAFSSNVTQAHSLIAAAETHADSAQWRLARADFDAAVQQQPSYYLPWISRAQFFTRVRLWNEASDDYAKAINLGAPTNTPQWWGTGALLAWTGHDDALHELTQQFERQLESNQTIQGWTHLRTGLAVDHQLSLDSYRAIAEFAESQLAEMEDSGSRTSPHRFPPPPRRPDRRHESGDGPPMHRRQGQQLMVEIPPRAVCEYVTGMAHLRAQQFDLAIDRLQECAQDDQWPAVGLVHAPLALAYNAMGQKEKALASLERSKVAVDQMADELLLVDGPMRPTPWFDFIELLQIHRSVAEALTGQTPADPEQLAQIRRQAIDQLEQ